MSAEMRLKGKNYAADPVEVDFRAGPLGSQVTLSFNDMAILRGFGWHTETGAFSTGITGGGAGTVFDLDQPEGGLSIPSGWCLRPLRITIQLQPVTTTTADQDENEALIAVDTGAIWYGDGTVTAETVKNMRTDLGRGSPAGTSVTSANSNCPIRVFSAATADLTRDGTADPVLDMELARMVNTEDNQSAVGIVQSQMELVYAPTHAPFIVGPACVYLYWGGTNALTGFAQAEFLAFPANLITNIA